MTGTPKRQVRIATRGSALALWQADFVTKLLGDRGVTGEKLVLKTTADRVQDRFLHEMGGKGLFVKELEEALERGEADLAIHSLKDMPAVVPPPFTLAAILPRHAPTDLMIFRADVAAHLNPSPLLGAPEIGAFGELTIGTGSLRRQALLAKAAPKAKTVGVRGNVDTRLRKLQEGAWDALILAEASLDRLNLKAGWRTARLDPRWFVPCASQGALAIETVATHPLTPWLGRELGSPETTAQVAVERGLLARLGGDCTMPFGCLVNKDSDGAGDGTYVGRAVILTRDGREARAEHRMAAPLDPAKMLDALTAKLKDAGARSILEALGLAVTEPFR